MPNKLAKQKEIEFLILLKYGCKVKPYKKTMGVNIGKWTFVQSGLTERESDQYFVLIHDWKEYNFATKKDAQNYILTNNIRLVKI